MPYWKRRTLFLAFLIGGLLLGTLPRGRAYTGHRHRHRKVAAPQIVSFRHGVDLREGRIAPEPGEYALRPSETANLGIEKDRIVPEPGANVPRRLGTANLGTGKARLLPNPSVHAPRPFETANLEIEKGRLFPNPSVYAPSRDQLWVQPTSFTPYDRYMGNVRSVINHLEPHPANMSLACQLMKEGRRFDYVMGLPYTANPPAVTAMARAGDCKSKALWLYRGLGDADALFVIGKVVRNSHTSHAWVYWHNENRWWILDCTIRSEPIAADSVSEDRYVPYYSYGRSGAFRHRATCLMINPVSPNGGAQAVADHSK
jgi:hypothetical protein